MRQCEVLQYVVAVSIITSLVLNECNSYELKVNVQMCGRIHANLTTVKRENLAEINFH